MEPQTAAALVPSHISPEHPIVTRDYSLFTLAIHDMANAMAGWLDDQADGATIFGPSRFGKSSAVNHWLQRLLSERHGGFVPMVVLRIPLMADSDSIPIADSVPGDGGHLARGS